jgi:hypothetical protein
LPAAVVLLVPAQPDAANATVASAAPAFTLERILISHL